MLLVLTTLPDQTSAQAVARTLVTEGLCACASIGAPQQSIYHWQGRLEESRETPLHLKVAAPGYAALEQRLMTLHPYELPEIIALPVQQGLPAYLAWVAEHTANADTSS